MSHRKLLFAIARLVLLIFILTGFTLLCFGVSKDYFEYRTTSVIEIYDYPEDDVVAPAIVICYRFDLDPRKEAKIGQLLSGNHYNDINNTWKVDKLEARISPNASKVQYVTKKYILDNKYCMFLKVLDHFKIEDVISTRWRDMSRFYTVDITAGPIHAPDVYGFDKPCDPRVAYFQIISDESSIPNYMNRIATAELCRDHLFYLVLLTYASSIIVRRPPPYDTNCLDYNNTGLFLSSFDCYDKCLKIESMKWNVLPGMTIIDTEEYQKSEGYIAPNLIIEDENYLTTLEKNQSIPSDLVERYRNLSIAWKGIKRSCRMSCSRLDCKVEQISPNIHMLFGKTANVSSRLSHVRPVLLLSDQPTLQVSYVPKQQLRDYIIYMLSMISFWLGFCPLTLADTLLKRLGPYTRGKNMTVALEERVRRLGRDNDNRKRRLISHRPRTTHSLTRIS